MAIVNHTLQNSGSVWSVDRVVRPQSGWLRLIAILLLISVTACSTRFLYNKIDTFVVWKIGSFVSLSKAQKEELKLQVGDQLEQVRQDELPRVAQVPPPRMTTASTGPTRPTPRSEWPKPTPSQPRQSQQN